MILAAHCHEQPHQCPGKATGQAISGTRAPVDGLKTSKTYSCRRTASLDLGPQQPDLLYLQWQEPWPFS
jgi:hypothetical protein